MSYIVRGPIGGMTWHHLNYFLGLKKLGHNVTVIEDSGDWEECCYNPRLDVTAKDSSYGIGYATDLFNRIGFPHDWAYFNKHENKWEGPSEERIYDIIEGADMLINVSLVNPIRPWLEKVPVKIAVDTDPVFTQIKNITDKSFRELTNAHTHHFTFGENFGKHGCTIPDDKFAWIPTRQPLDLGQWQQRPGNQSGKWTTIMLWESYRSQALNGISYGMKSLSFDEFRALPSLVPGETIELAMGNNGPAEELRSKGWSIINPLIPSTTPWDYRQYISSSKGEWSVAKHGYASTDSGWFSERSACYLASGRPVIIQETGFSKNIPAGKGVMAFKTLQEAVERINEINASYEQHCNFAREIAEEYFDSGKILSQLLNAI